MSHELYKKYRPKRLGDVVGQTSAVTVLKGMFKTKRIPHTILFLGPSGCGKTTLARIVKDQLGCSDTDFHELNCAADARGIDTVREIRSRMSLAGINGGARVWLLDEAQQLTADAQNALLKMTEDTPKHVYFMLATTNPDKIVQTLRTRSSKIKVELLTDKEMRTLLTRVTENERLKLSEDVIDKLVECAEGSARQGLVLLDQIVEVKGEDNQLEAIAGLKAKTEAIELARMLFNPRSQWNDVASLIKNITDEPERIRHMVLGYSTSVLLGGGKLCGRAYEVINAFQDNFYDSKKAGLAAACFEVMKR